MKVLLVNDKYEYGGGAEQYMFDICDGLERRGHKVAVIYGKPIENLKFKIENLKGRREFLIINLETEGVLEVVKKENPDIIYLQNVFKPKLVESLTKLKPTVRFVHDHRLYCPGSSKLWFRANKICNQPFSWHCAFRAYTQRCMSRRPPKMLRQLIRVKKGLEVSKKLACLIVASNFMKKNLWENGISEEKIVVNPLFAGTQIYTDEKRIDADPPIILFVGRIFIEKGVDFLLKAGAKLKSDYQVLIIGEGWDKKRVEKLAKDLGLGKKVTFLGWLPHSEVLKYYAKAYMVVIPSIWGEPFGMIGLEAMAAGKPVVAFAVGGIPEWLEDKKTGFLVKRGDVDDLALKIETLLKDRKLAFKFGQAGRKVVEQKFTLDKHLDCLIEIFSGLV